MSGGPRAGWQLDRRVPIAVVFALVLQAAGAIWWASAKDTADRQRDYELNALQQQMGEGAAVQAQVIERLARIEERTAVQVSMLQEIREYIDGKRH